ncbi:helix-turn-helix transcriptional regulator [Oerskovia sp. M15]
MSISERPAQEPPQVAGNVALSRREKIVLSNLSEDITLERLAADLFVTRNTVKSQLRSIYRKIGVSTRAEAVGWARDNGIPTL